MASLVWTYDGEARWICLQTLIICLNALLDSNYVFECSDTENQSQAQVLQASMLFSWLVVIEVIALKLGVEFLIPPQQNGSLDL